MKPGDFDNVEKFLGWYTTTYGEQLSRMIQTARMQFNGRYPPQRAIIGSMLGQIIGAQFAIDKLIDPGKYANMKMSDYIAILSMDMVDAAQDREKRQGQIDKLKEASGG